MSVIYVHLSDSSINKLMADIQQHFASTVSRLSHGMTTPFQHDLSTLRSDLEGCEDVQSDEKEHNSLRKGQGVLAVESRRSTEDRR